MKRFFFILCLFNFSYVWSFKNLVQDKLKKENVKKDLCLKYLYLKTYLGKKYDSAQSIKSLLVSRGVSLEFLNGELFDSLEVLFQFVDWQEKQHAL